MASSKHQQTRQSLGGWPRLAAIALLGLLFGVASPAPADAATKGKVAAKAPAKPAKKKAAPAKAAKGKATPAKGKATKGKPAKGKAAKGKGKKHQSYSEAKGFSRVCKDVEVGKGKRKKTKRSCKRVKTFQGHGVARSTLRTAALERPSGDIEVWSDNLSEGTTVNIYKRDAEGKPTAEFDDAALAKLDEVFRCKRTQEVRAVDPNLYAQLSRILDHFRQVDSSRRIELVSGFRFAERDSSRHHHASAMDIRIKGVTIREMYDYAESLDVGGMGVGIYPNSGFIHVDFRAPGEDSYRWTDLSGPGENNPRDRGKKAKGKGKPAPTKGRKSPARKPTS